MTKAPTYDQLMNPTIQALKALGGSGTIEEIYHNEDCTDRASRDRQKLVLFNMKVD